MKMGVVRMPLYCMFCILDSNNAFDIHYPPFIISLQEWPCLPGVIYNFGMLCCKSISAWLYFIVIN